MMIIVQLPENLRAYFELSAQAWILYKAPQWNARYPNSCPERIKLKMHWGCGPRPLFEGLIQRRWTPWSKLKHGFDNYHNKDSYIISFLICSQIHNKIIKQTLTAKGPRKVIIKLLKLGCPSTFKRARAPIFKRARAPIFQEGSSTHFLRGLSLCPN